MYLSRPTSVCWLRPGKTCSSSRSYANKSTSQIICQGDLSSSSSVGTGCDNPAHAGGRCWSRTWSSRTLWLQNGFGGGSDEDLLGTSIANRKRTLAWAHNSKNVLRVRLFVLTHNPCEGRKLILRYYSWSWQNCLGLQNQQAMELTTVEGNNNFINWFITPINNNVTPQPL